MLVINAQLSNGTLCVSIIIIIIIIISTCTVQCISMHWNTKVGWVQMNNMQEMRLLFQ